VLLLPSCTWCKTSKVSQYQLVSHFLPGTEATIAVAGDTGNGCKFVLLDRERNRTCCYSDRGTVLCDPQIQSPGCRVSGNIEVEELVGQCVMTLPGITSEDAGPYLVIFPGKVDDNENFDVVVSDGEVRQPRMEAGEYDVRMYRAVASFTPGTTGTLAVLGDTTDGCKFQFLNRGRNLTCCFSPPDRGDSLCDPASQSRGCRGGSNSTVHEVKGQCLLTLPEIASSDSGPYRVMFPGKLSDNEQFSLTVLVENTTTKKDTTFMAGGSGIFVFAIGLAVVLFGVAIFAIITVFKKSNTRHHVSNYELQVEEKKESSLTSPLKLSSNEGFTVTV